MKKQQQTNSLAQAIGESGQGVDVMRISYNVMKNMQQEEQTDRKSELLKAQGGKLE